MTPHDSKKVPMTRKIAGELTRLNALAPVDATPHDSTRCAEQELGRPLCPHQCDDCAGVSPSEPVGAVDAETQLVAFIVDLMIEAVDAAFSERTLNKEAEAKAAVHRYLQSRATPAEGQYATIEEVWNWVANELDETRTPEDAARLKAAMEALIPTTPPRSPATVTEAMKAKAHVALCEVFAEFDDGSWEPSSVDELLEVVITAALTGGRDA